MKKLIYLIVAIVILGLLVSGCIPVVPTLGEKGNGNGNNGLKPGTDFNGPHYNLNLIGKKAEWPGGGNNNNDNFNNPDRHTIFVPEDTEGFSIYVGKDEEGEDIYVPGIKIWMSQGDEFAVLDGNAFDDGEASFQLARGEYEVYIVAKAKPNGYTDITGWVYCTDTNEYYFKISDKLRVTKSKKWKDAADLFYVDEGEDIFADLWPEGYEPTYPVWVFTYLQMLKAADGMDMDEALYFWQYDNHGNKLVKVRFYEKPK